MLRRLRSPKLNTHQFCNLSTTLAHRLASHLCKAYHRRRFRNLRRHLGSLTCSRCSTILNLKSPGRNRPIRDLHHTVQRPRNTHRSLLRRPLRKRLRRDVMSMEILQVRSHPTADHLMHHRAPYRPLHPVGLSTSRTNRLRAADTVLVRAGSNDSSFTLLTARGSNPSRCRPLILGCLNLRTTTQDCLAIIVPFSRSTTHSATTHRRRPWLPTTIHHINTHAHQV